MTEEQKKYVKQHLKAVQKKELDILCEVRDICNRNNIEYWLDGGTFLGAVRHGGFIPWDDDIDICIREEDTKRFMEVMQRELPNNLFLQTSETDPSYQSTIMKIRENNSFLVEFCDDFNRDYHKGIYIDVFPMTDYPNVSKTFCHAVTAGYCKANSILNKQHLYSWRSVAELFWFGAKRALMRILWGMANTFCKKGTYYATLLQNNGLGFMHRKDAIFPLKPIQFEGETFLSPASPDIYLTEQYGDYMQLPPEDKRQVHATFYMEKLV